MCYSEFEPDLWDTDLSLVCVPLVHFTDDYLSAFFSVFGAFFVVFLDHNLTLVGEVKLGS